MRRIVASSATLPLILAIFSVSTLAESGPPRRELRVYALPGIPADISPGETSTVSQVTRLEHATDPSKLKAVETAQLWDFRQQRLIAEAKLNEVITDKEHLAQDSSTPRFTRFTNDGKLALVYISHFLYVLAGDDLHEIRTISLAGPPGETISFSYKHTPSSYVDTPRLEVMEVSSIGHKVAAMWIRNSGPSQLDVYDLDSGQRLTSLNTYRAKGLQWVDNDRNFVLAVPNTIPCLRPTDQPDLFVIDASSGALRMQLNTGLLIGGVAVTPDDRAWVVDSDCRGIVTNHTPKMKVFDLHTGRRLHEIDGRGTGVRYAVSANRSGDRIVAFTGIVKSKFDLLDGDSYDTIIDRTFSVWDGKSYDGIVTSQVLPPFQRAGTDPTGGTLRISAKGTFVLFGPNIYELP